MKKSYLNSEKNSALSSKPSRAMGLFLMVLFVCLFGNIESASSATITSNATGGDWSAPATWAGGVVPTASDDVVIASGSIVTLNIQSITIGTLTINGQLNLMPDIRHGINTSSIVILFPGTILFDKKSDLLLPSNVSIQVTKTGTTYKGLSGDCTNNNAIFIGTIEYAVCVGNNADTRYTFNEIMDQGGYNVVNVSTTSTTSGSVCGSGSFTFKADVIPSTSAIIKWYDAAIGGNLLRTSTSSGSDNYTTSVISTTTTYYVEATIGSFTTPRKAVTVNPVNTNTWNGTIWSNGTPTSNQALVFSSGYSSTGDVEGCTCTVTNGAVVIKSGHTLKIINGVYVNGGSLTFENTASLVQTNDVANTGSIIYKRTTPTLIETDYTYWSSPVTGQKLEISPDYTYGSFYSYDYFVNNWKGQSPSDRMDVGKGYIIRGQRADNNVYNITGTFIGVPNNGEKTIAIGQAGTANLIGNPYPSAINADLFLAANAGVLDGTLYFWTHRTTIQLASGITDGTAGSGVYAYTSNDYASYNKTGGVATSIGNTIPGTPTTEQVSNRPTGKIAAGQAFFTTSKNAGTVTFNNDMRVVGGTTLPDGTKVNQQFFKTKTPTKEITTAIEKNRIWLNLTNAKGAFKQVLVGYIAGATNDYEGSFDGESFDGNAFVDFYSINKDKNLAIQGRALPFDEKDEVPLGFRTAIDGAFTINIDGADGLFANQSVFLEDKLTNTVTDLKKGNYSFNTAVGTFNNRFVLRYTKKTANKRLSLEETDTNDGIIILYSNNYKTLIVKNNIQDATVNSVALFNMSGQQIDSWNIKDKEQTSIQIPIKNVSPEIYIVKVKTTKGETTEKIIIR